MITLQKVLHTAPDLGRHDGRLLAEIELVLVTDLAGISHIGQQPVQAASALGLDLARIAMLVTQSASSART